MIKPQHKAPTTHDTQDLDFATTQQIDPALAELMRSRGEPAPLPGDFDDTEILVDLGVSRPPAARR
ncbi:MAG TPA: hypothetical protein VHH11_03955 [Gammaproteobacteria bacterium]|nr:hypothetical protein [Gammaproteobacteria bacterium]